MKRHTREIAFTTYESSNELEPRDRQLIEKAVQAAEGAYAPYSQFKVGAAVEMNDGTVVEGNNQENMAYPSGLCAERVAMFAAMAAHPKNTISAIAIATTHVDHSGQTVFSPCGSCRQVMVEMEQRAGKALKIILKDPDGTVNCFEGIGHLMPFSFKNPALFKNKSK